MSVSAFLIGVKKFCVERRVTKCKLFVSAIDLFVGKTLIWYRAHKKDIHDWKSLVVFFKNHFQPANYNDTFFEKIRRRTHSQNKLSKF